MRKYSYRNKKTRMTVQSDTPLNDPDLVLITQVSDTRMKRGEVRQKGQPDKPARPSKQVVPR